MKNNAAQIKSNIERTYIENHPKSESLVNAGKLFTSGGVARNVQFYSPFPIVVSTGHGDRMTDVDGLEYIDLNNNFTTLIWGHANPMILEAIREQIVHGTVFPAPSPIQYEMSEFLCDRVPCVEQVRFVNSGTEAAMWVLRLARAYTGKNKIVKMEGGYNGLYEGVDISFHPHLSTAGSANKPISVAEDQGIPESVVANTIIVPFNDKKSTRAIIEENIHDIAAVIVEPMLGTIGMIPPEEGYLRLLRELTEHYNIPLIFDEVITLRFAPGGAQERFGILPDLCMMGKIIGGGMAIGAFGGRREIMELTSPIDTVVTHSGTFSANNVSLAAGLAAMKALTTDVFRDLEEKGAYFRGQADKIFKEIGIKGHMTGLCSCFAAHFHEKKVRSYRDIATSANNRFIPLLTLEMLNRGIFWGKSATGAVSAVTPKEDLDTCLVAFHESLKKIKPVVEEEALHLIIT